MPLARLAGEQLVQQTTIYAGQARPGGERRVRHNREGGKRRVGQEREGGKRRVGQEREGKGRAGQEREGGKRRVGQEREGKGRARQEREGKRKAKPVLQNAWIGSGGAGRDAHSVTRGSGSG